MKKEPEFEYTFGLAGGVLVTATLIVAFFLTTLYAFSALPLQNDTDWMLASVFFIGWMFIWCIVLSVSSPLIIVVMFAAETALQIIWWSGRIIFRLLNSRFQP